MVEQKLDGTEGGKTRKRKFEVQMIEAKRKK